MLTKTRLALAAATSMALGAAALLPATASAANGAGLILANYAPCYENPAAAGCPGYIGPAKSKLSANVTEHRSRHLAHEQRMPTRPRG
jgi:hypothetical protein